LNSAATVQNWTPCRRRTQEVCDFLNTSSGHAISTYYQSNLESTQDQPSFFRLKFWAQVANSSHLVKMSRKWRNIIFKHLLEDQRKHECDDGRNSCCSKSKNNNPEQIPEPFSIHIPIPIPKF
jgi:hypothetical protein